MIVLIILKIIFLYIINLFYLKGFGTECAPYISKHLLFKKCFLPTLNVKGREAFNLIPFDIKYVKLIQQASKQKKICNSCSFLDILNAVCELISNF